MRRKIALAGLVAFGLLLTPYALRAAAIEKLTDQPLNQYFPFAGMSFRVDKIETVAQADGRPVIGKISGGFDHAKGYIMVTCSVQNPSSNETIDMPSTMIGFELLDGTQIDEAGPAGVFLASSYNAAPNSLHPKQHVDVMFVLTEWNGQAPTKMFFKVNGGTAGNNAGYHNVRFQLPKDYVKVLQPVPGG